MYTVSAANTKTTSGSASGIAGMTSMMTTALLLALLKGSLHGPLLKNVYPVGLHGRYWLYL